MRGRFGSRGQSTPLWAIVLLLAALLLVPVSLLAKATIERAKAQNAADAAALAGALHDEAEARTIAARNGATVLDYTESGDEIEVTVRYGDREATARARRSFVPVEAGAPAQP